MRVLVIEDETKVGSFIKRALEEESYAVDLCEDGAQGLDMALSGSYDLIMIDLMLPSLPGLEVLARLRKEKIQTPVMILTAQSKVDQRVKGLDAGADDYLTKPFAIDELLARVRALLRRGPVEAPGILQIDDLMLNPATPRSYSRRTAHRPHGEGICATGILHASCRASPHPPDDFRPCLESGFRYLHQCHRRLCQLSPQ